MFAYAIERLETLAVTFPDSGGYRFQVPDHAEERHQLQHVEGDVELPPVKALAHGGGVVVMVVVPSLAQRDDGEPDIVTAGVAGLVALAAEDVRQVVDGVGAVVNGHGGHEEPPHQHLPAVRAQARRHVLEQNTEQEDADSENRRHYDVETIEEAKFRVLQQILDPRQIRGEMHMRHEPAHMAPKKPVLHGRMYILRLVGVDVVMAMVRSPPNRAALHRGGAQQAEYELTHARGLEGTVREIPMIEARDGEHAYQVEHQSDQQRRPAETNPNHGETG